MRDLPKDALSIRVASIARKLIAAGADPTMKNKSGETAGGMLARENIHIPELRIAKDNRILPPWIRWLWGK